jgi:hypothetical protein
MNKDMKEKEGMKNDVKKLGYEVEDLQVANASVEDRVATLETFQSNLMNRANASFDLQYSCTGNGSMDVNLITGSVSGKPATWTQNVGPSAILPAGTTKIYIQLFIWNTGAIATTNQVRVHKDGVANNISDCIIAYNCGVSGYVSQASGVVDLASGVFTVNLPVCSGTIIWALSVKGAA